MALKTAHQNPDVGFIAMVQRLDHIYAEWDLLAEADEEDPRIDALSSESVVLEREILATPAALPVSAA